MLRFFWQRLVFVTQRAAIAGIHETGVAATTASTAAGTSGKSIATTTDLNWIHDHGVFVVAFLCFTVLSVESLRKARSRKLILLREEKDDDDGVWQVGRSFVLFERASFDRSFGRNEGLVHSRFSNELVAE